MAHRIEASQFHITIQFSMALLPGLRVQDCWMDASLFNYDTSTTNAANTEFGDVLTLRQHGDQEEARRILVLAAKLVAPLMVQESLWAERLVEFPSDLDWTRKNSFQCRTEL